MAFNKYQVIKKVINYELANFIFNYFLLKRDAVEYMYKNNIIFDNNMLGTWTDQQIPNTYSHYADPVMETLLVKVLPTMQEETGLNLIPTYSYARLYKNGDIFHRHKDRMSCEISTTINLGGDPWPIFINPNPNAGYVHGPKIGEHRVQKYEPTNDEGVKVLLEVGDMLVYTGCDLEHWREPFDGNICGQVFLHYNHVNGPYAEKNKFDRRPMLGLPALTKK